MYSNCYQGNRDDDGHKVRRQYISQERGSRLSSFVVKRMFTKGDSSLSHTMTPVPGSSMLFCLKRNKGLAETACRNPPVKHSLTNNNNKKELKDLYAEDDET